MTIAFTNRESASTNREFSDGTGFTAPDHATHATYLPDRHMFALWPLPSGGTTESRSVIAPETVRLALPTRDLSGFDVSEVECRVIEPDDLPDIALSAPGQSVRAWRALAAGKDFAMPVAGHAVADPTGARVTSSAHVQAVFRHTTAVAAELRNALTVDLRPYQIRGVSWLRDTLAAHSGAVLADEMGLGKTVQAIGCLVGRADEGPQLVVSPTTLVENWRHEIDRFAPGLRPQVWRGGPVDPTAEGTVVLTSYPVMRAHGRALAEYRWATAVFDEAQTLKNPRTQVSKAARAVPADARIALTGTPLENRLDELWALLNLVAPQLFGHRAQFRRRHVRPIELGTPHAAARLRAEVEPVVLMRKKSQVARSLPPKIHAELVCELTGEQQQLYDTVLGRAIDDGFGDGAQRPARVLAALTGLKQVCNHPALISADSAELAGRSGKLDLCTEIVAAHLESNSPTLIFTQYRKTGELLVRHFHEQFGLSVPFFHGGMTQRRRAAITRAFQADDGPMLLVLSLKAGGTGLTLTRATEVIHFDRWWNPAVEAQASDRAHRIGQTRAVTVTTLTTATTVEEHIARMHSRKSTLFGVADTAAPDPSGIPELVRLDDDRLIETLRRKRGN